LARKQFVSIHVRKKTQHIDKTQRLLQSEGQFKEEHKVYTTNKHSDNKDMTLWACLMKLFDNINVNC